MYEASPCSCIGYKNLNSEQFAIDLITSDVPQNSLSCYMVNYKLPQNITIDPTYGTQRRTVTQKNRYFDTVIVKGMVPAVIDVTLATTGTFTYTSDYIVSAVSSTVATATVAISGKVATITPVAAGTTVVTLKDKFNNTVATVNVTVA